MPTGIAHGTVTVIADRVPYEVTTLRRDVETHGRHATVAFTDDWAADARRRDFTINALYCSADGEVFDPLGGAADIEARRVRFIGDARERIREDYLRILRFFRLTAEYGVGRAGRRGRLRPVCSSATACSACRPNAYARRCCACWLRRAGRSWCARCWTTGCCRWCWASRRGRRCCGGWPTWRPRSPREPDAILRLAALAVEVPEDASRLAERLRLSNDERVRLERVAAHTPDLGPAESEAAARAYLYAEGAAAYRDRVLMAWARSGDATDSQPWRARLALPERWQPRRFPLGGADVMALGVPAGPRVGELLRAVEAWWIAGDFAADEAGLRDQLRKLVTPEQEP